MSKFMRNWYYHRPVKEPFEYILSSPKWAECLTCADLEGFVRGGSNSKTVFLLVGEGIEDPNITTNGSSSVLPCPDVIKLF